MRVEIKGPVVSDDIAWIYDLFEEKYISPSKVAQALAEANGEDLDIEINSGGGDVFAGSEIYSAIRAYHGNVRIHVVGLAASAASVIACAGHSDISPTAQIMVHNVSTFSAGDYHDMDKTSELLKQANRSIAAAYVAKSGLSEAEALELMDAETWLTADDAVTYGLIDEIAENKNTNNIKTDSSSEDIRLAAAVGGQLLPPSVIRYMQNRKNELIQFFNS